MVLAEFRDLPIIYYRETHFYVVVTFGDDKKVNLVIADKHAPCERSLCRLLEEEGEFVEGDVQMEFLKSREIPNGYIDDILDKLFREIGSDEDHEYDNC